MSERRRGERHMLTPPGVGTLRVLQDVEVTYLDSEQAVVVASGTIPLGERLRLEIPDDRVVRSQAWLARAVSNRVLIGNGTLRWETRLSIAPRSDDAAPAIGTVGPDGDSRGPVAGAVVRRVPIRLIQASASGCLWESPTVVDEGTVGFIDVRTSEHSHTEAVRILRTWRSAAEIWPCRMAVEFLTIAPPAPDSLRGVAALMAVGAPSRRVP